MFSDFICHISLFIFLYFNSIIIGSINSLKSYYLHRFELFALFDIPLRNGEVSGVVLVVQFRIKNYRWIQTLTTHSYRVSLDVKYLKFEYMYTQ